MEPLLVKAVQDLDLGSDCIAALRKLALRKQKDAAAAISSLETCVASSTLLSALEDGSLLNGGLKERLARAQQSKWARPDSVVSSTSRASSVPSRTSRLVAITARTASSRPVYAKHTFNIGPLCVFVLSIAPIVVVLVVFAVAIAMVDTTCSIVVSFIVVVLILLLNVVAAALVSSVVDYDHCRSSQTSFFFSTSLPPLCCHQLWIIVPVAQVRQSFFLCSHTE